MTRARRSHAVHQVHTLTSSQKLLKADNVCWISDLSSNQKIECVVAGWGLSSDLFLIGLKGVVVRALESGLRMLHVLIGSVCSVKDKFFLGSVSHLLCQSSLIIPDNTHQSECEQKNNKVVSAELIIILWFTTRTAYNTTLTRTVLGKSAGVLF